MAHTPEPFGSPTATQTITPTRSLITVGQRKTPSPGAASPEPRPGTATAVSNSPLAKPTSEPITATVMLSPSIESAAEALGQLLNIPISTSTLTESVSVTDTVAPTLYLPMITVSGAPTQSQTSPAASVFSGTALFSPLHPVPNITAPILFPIEPTRPPDETEPESSAENTEPDATEPDGTEPDDTESDATEDATTAEADTGAAAGPDPAPTAVTKPTADGVARTNRVPILMYHYLSVPPAGADIYRTDLSVAPNLFAAHLDAMQAAGYQTITLYDLLANLTQGAPLPEKSVIITFDDGYRDNYTNAFPLLAERNMSATFFIVTDFIDDGLPQYVTWDMVREMHAGGMQIESHGRNHFSLQNRDWDFLVWQALGSAETIEYELGVRPHFVSYPAGEYDQLTIEVFQSAQYWAGVTTVQGASHSSERLFELERIRVRNTTDVAELMRLLELDW